MKKKNQQKTSKSQLFLHSEGTGKVQYTLKYTEMHL